MKKQSKSWEDLKKMIINEVIYCYDQLENAEDSSSVIIGEIERYLKAEISAAEERRRKEGYEVGFNQGQSETGMPKPIRDEIRKEELTKIKKHNVIIGKADLEMLLLNERQEGGERIIKEIEDYRDKYFPILDTSYVVITEMLKYPPFQP